MAAPVEVEDRYRRPLEALPDAIIVHCDGIIVFANSSAVEMLRVASVDALIGWPAMDIVHPDSRGRILELRERMVERGNQMMRAENKFVGPDGTEFIGSGSGTSFVWDGRPANLVVIRDFTEQINSRNARR